MDSRYVLWLQTIPIVSLIFSSVFVSGIFYLLWDFDIQASSGAYPFLWVVAQGVIVCSAGTVSAIFFLKIARASWFFLCRYHLTDEYLSATNPVSGRTVSIQLREIHSLTNFFVHGPSPKSPASQGHILISKSGKQIRLSEALAMWPEISKYCVALPMESPSDPWHQKF